jgi:hypothetical protein
VSEPFRSTLVVHCIWHPDSDAGAVYGNALFAHLFEDPNDLGSHGLRIPVRHWSTFEPALELDYAKKNVLVVFLDDAALGDRSWLQWISALSEEKIDGETNRLLPAAVSPRAAQVVDSSINRWNPIRLHEHEDAIKTAVLLNRVTHSLCRIYGDSPRAVRVFLSHAKLDGLPIAKAVRDFLQDGSGVDKFFDAQDLLEGELWDDAIRKTASERNVLLAIRTDAYASREWCRTEVLEAKRGGAPVVVLDALDSVEARGFPYLGNGPSVRWREGWTRLSMEELLGILLKQTLRFRYFPSRVEDLCSAYGLAKPELVMAAPPELLTVLRARDASGKARALVYPDPPLGTEELSLVSEFAPELEPITPNTLVARG